MNIPNDPVMLLSCLNMQLRDYYPSLDELCASLALSKEEIAAKLNTIDYRYDEKTNQFI